MVYADSCSRLYLLKPHNHTMKKLWQSAISTKFQFECIEFKSDNNFKC